MWLGAAVKRPPSTQNSHEARHSKRTFHLGAATSRWHENVMPTLHIVPCCILPP